MTPGGRRWADVRVSSSLLAWVKVLVFTGGLTLGLGLLDLQLGGPRSRWGYVEVARMSDLPEALGPRLAPNFFPDSLRWPPARVLYRDRGGRAWFLGVRARESNALVLWLGATESPDVPAPATLSGCLSVPPGPRCPAGWHTVARPVAEGFTAYVITTLPPSEAEMILEGLVRAERPR